MSRPFAFGTKDPPTSLMFLLFPLRFAPTVSTGQVSSALGVLHPVRLEGDSGTWFDAGYSKAYITIMLVEPKLGGFRALIIVCQMLWSNVLPMGSDVFPSRVFPRVPMFGTWPGSRL